jgi:hypothetical protein
MYVKLIYKEKKSHKWLQTEKLSGIPFLVKLKKMMLKQQATLLSNNDFRMHC